MFEQLRVEKDWPGETAFIIGGGPSLLSQNTDLLRGKKLIVINSSYQRFPDADYCVFSDMRWWCEHRTAMMNFKGKIIGFSNAPSGPPKVYRMQRTNKPGLAEDPGMVMVRNTTTTAAINLAVHLGVARIVLLGIDQKNGADGRTHHHAPHKWRPMPNCWARQQSDLPAIAEGLKARNIECVNASPGSALTIWPLVQLEEYLARDQGAGAAAESAAA